MIVKNSLKAFAFALVAAACTQPQPADEFTISGTVTGIDSGTVVLKRPNLEDRTSTTLDSVAFSGGHFELNGKLDGPELLTLTILPGNWGLSVFAENSEISIEVDTAGANHYDWSGYGGVKGAQLVNYTVEGSRSHDQLDEYEKHPDRVRFMDFFADVRQRTEAAPEDQKAAIQQEGDSVRRLMDDWERHWLDSFIAAEPSSVAGAYAFHRYFQFNEDMELERMEQLLGQFQDAAKASPYYAQLDDSYRKRLALVPGEVAPDFTALRPDSTEFTLSSTRGKLVLLDFWASWCVPCRQSIPHWKEVYAKYADKGFEIVAVTNDNRWSDWLQALEEENMPWIQVADEFPVKNMPARIGTLYMTPFLPTYVLLDADGKIIFHNGSKEEITDEIEKRLGSEV